MILGWVLKGTLSINVVLKICDNDLVSSFISLLTGRYLDVFPSLECRMCMQCFGNSICIHEHSKQEECTL